MEIGKIIRTYRKKKNMTQEEMANRLGVTAPAVNKWEMGNSMPDILLLAPIARLLGITVDELLSFREEMTEDEINRFIYELDARLKEEPFDQVFAWAKRRLEEYPGCHGLIWRTAVVLDAGIRIRQAADPEKYDDYISGWYGRAMESGDETVRVNAAGSLFAFWMRKGEYDKAQSCLAAIPDQNPDKKRKQAMVYEKTGRTREAYQACEELLFSFYGNIMLVFNSMYMLDVERQDWERAEMLAVKQGEAARLFDMGRYDEVSPGLYLAIAREDVDATRRIVEDMLDSIGCMGSYSGSPLYEHMKFKEPRKEFVEEFRKNFTKRLRDKETFGYMREDRQWQELVGEDG